MRQAISRSALAVLVAASVWSCGSVATDDTAARATKPATATLPDDRSSTDVGTPPMATTPVSSTVDASVPDSAPTVPVQTPNGCFLQFKGKVVGPDYDQFAPKMAAHCAGTHQQTIQGVEKLVFLGDSITMGTPPNLPAQLYRELVTAGIKQRFGANVELGNCSRWGARNDDLLSDGGKTGQIQQCFPSGVETKKTLVVMTMGGNDIAAWANDQLTSSAAMAEADKAATHLGAALTWLKDPARFPNGSYVVFSNVYEFTDTSGDLHACPTAGVAGLKPNYAQGTAAVVYLQEQYMKQAVATGTDLVFLLEQFCGHGYKHADPTLQCYRGPKSENWFDLTCIHPNPTGHAKIAEFMLQTIDG